MPTLTASGITVYRCATWTEGATHGGNIGTTKITSSTDQNIFDDVTNTERVAGDTEYRKIYIRNGNATEWSDVICWMVNTTPANNDDIYICAGGKSSYEGSSTTIPGVAIFHHGSKTVTGTGTYFLKDLAVGEAIYNVTNDSAIYAYNIDSIASNTSLQLNYNYDGTGGSSKKVAVAPITNVFVNWVQPFAFDDAFRLILGDLGPAATTDYKAVWIRRDVLGGIPNGYTNNYFTLMFQVDGDV